MGSQIMARPAIPASVSILRRRRRGARGFTLVELLVVVAIISLLMSILTPSVSRARQQAKSTICLTRLREFITALTAYSTDQDGQLPPMRYGVTDPNGPPWHGWAEALYIDLYNDQNFTFEEDFPVQRNRGGRFELWMCVSAEPRTDSTGHYRPYEYSWARRNLENIPIRLPVITDANPMVTDPDDLMRSDIPMERLAGLEGEAYIDERHYGGANYVFNDGHAIRSTNLKELLAEDWDLNPETENGAE
jgi:prepilin-type N-terminal cleavage/methylation domain-containing protein/prepilin-type processing-associated H-X9-DG protein